MPFDRIKLRAARNFAWRKDGPIQKYFAERVLPEFLATRFDQPGERMQFVGGLLSRASIAKMHESMETCARQFDELVAADLKLPVADRYGVSLFAGLRPWEFSAFTKLRRGPRGSSSNALFGRFVSRMAKRSVRPGGTAHGLCILRFSRRDTSSRGNHALSIVARNHRHCFVRCVQ
jgi:hypothetical protein